MNTVEPIRFNISGRGIDVDGNYDPRLSEIPTWSETSDFLLHQAATKFADEISRYTIREQFEELVEDEMKPVRNVLPQNPIGPGDISGRGMSTIYYTVGDSVFLPAFHDDGVVFVVSKNKGEARTHRDQLEEELIEMAGNYHGAGIEEISTFTGPEYVKNNISHPDAALSIAQDSPDEFEEEVADKIEPLTTAHFRAVKVNFDGYSAEPEFDILVSVSPRSLIQIEVKDYSGSDNNPGEEDIVHKPLQKAQLLNIEKTYSVVKGATDEEMKQLKKEAQIRGRLEVCEKSEIAEQLMPAIQSHLSPRGVFRGAR